MASLFARLFAYRPSADRLPQEDFFTEALAGVLVADRSLREAFTRWLIGHEVDHVSVETQKSLSVDNRIDIWIEARNDGLGMRHVAAMENKIRASEGTEQLTRYEAQLKCDPDAATRTLVYATMHERKCFDPSPNGPMVVFRPVHWFQVADWFRSWTLCGGTNADEGCMIMVRELLLLMEHWNMAMNLNADDLTAATAYRRSVEDRLIQILEDTKATCQLPGTTGNQWSRMPRYSRRYLCYSSPWVDDQEDVYVEFGFDFDRDDANWKVAELRLPSAYFAVRGTYRPELDELTGWESPPSSWGDDYLRVKQLPCLRVGGDNLHLGYLEFLRSARDELWNAIHA